MNKGFASLIILIIASAVLVGGIFGINLKNKISDTEELLENLGAQNAVGGKKYFLSGSGVSSSQSTIGLTKFEIAGGSQKIRMVDFGDLGCGTIQPGNSTKQEFVSFTGVTQNSDGTATLTGVSRGLEPIPDYSASTTLRTAHAGNSTFVISNSPPCFYEGYANITQDETITGVWTFNTNIPTSSLTATTSQQFINKGLLDSTTNQGAATSTETNGGIVELGTLAEQASGYDGGSAKPTVLQTKNSTSSPDIRGTYNIIAEADGYLDQDWIRTSDDFTWTGEHSLAATTTMATTTITGLGVGTTTPSVTGIGVVGDVYIDDGGLGVGIATTTDDNLEVAGTALISGDLHITGNQFGGRFGYTASSTAGDVSVTTTFTGSIPTNANFGIGEYAITDGLIQKGSITIARVGMTNPTVSLTTANTTADGAYTFSWSGANLTITEDTDVDNDSSISFTIHWYK